MENIHLKDMIPRWRRALLSLLRVNVRYTRRVTCMLDKQAVILTSNHLSLLDGVLIALASPKPLAFAVNVEHAKENPITRSGLAILAALGLGRVIAVDSERPLATRHLLQAIRAGQSVMVFPEGRISPDGRPLPTMSGVDWLAKRSGAPVLRLRLRGAEHSLVFAKAGNRLWPRVWLRF